MLRSLERKRTFDRIKRRQHYKLRQNIKVWSSTKNISINTYSHPLIVTGRFTIARNKI